MVLTAKAGVAGCCPDARSIYSHPALAQLVVPLLSPWVKKPLKPRPKTGAFFRPEVFQKFLKIFWGGCVFVQGVGCFACELSKFLQTAGSGRGTVFTSTPLCAVEKAWWGAGGVDARPNSAKFYFPPSL